jgi:hypothetical protein
MARTQEFSDDFNRANSSNLGSDWTENVGDAAITSNKLTITTAAANLTYNTNPTTKDQYAKITLSTEDNNNQIRLRNDATETTHYRYNFRGNNSDTVMLRVLSGSGTLVSSQGGHTYANGDTISAEVETTDASTVVIRTFINGSEHDSYSDTDANRIDSNGSVTLNFASTSVVLDDFEGGILSSGTNFTNYASITIDNTKVSGSSNHTDFPVLISGIFDGTGSEPDLRTAANGGNIQNTASGGASGSVTVPADLEFWSDNAASGTQYDHEIVDYDAATGELIAFVRVPTLQYSADTTFYMHYNDSGVTTSQENVTGVWKSEYKGVWHLQEASSTRYDSTSNNNDLTDNNTIGTTTGKFGTAADFVSSNSEYLNISDGSQTGLDISSTLSYSAWINVDSDGVRASVISKWVGTGSQRGFLTGPYADDKFGFQSTDDGGVTRFTNIFTDSAQMTGEAGNWVRLDGVFTIASTSSGQFYKDGSAVATTVTLDTGNSIYNSTAAFEISGENNGSADLFNGAMQEIRVYDGTLSADWIATEYNNQNSPSTFYTVGKGRTSEFTDDFNRANSTNLGSDWTEISGDARIYNNAVDGNSATFEIKCNTTPSTKDQYAKVTVKTQDHVQRIHLRHQDSVETYYAFLIRLASNNDVQIYRFNSGSYTLLNSVSFTHTNGETFEAEAETTDASTVTLRLFIDGVEKTSYEDTSGSRIDANGSVRYKIVNTSGGGAIDDFELGILGEGVAGSASASPSGSPSSSPSGSPSSSPSPSPSEGTPSSSPSEGTPSNSPSSSPSSSPSEGTPSSSPSEGTPSSSPSEGTPSSSPSEGTPSSSPSEGTPSSSPSGSPSSSPSFGTPSVTPSSSPSSSPSEGTPSTSPSSSPTPGWISYSREAVRNLVNNTNDLSIIYSESEIDDVSTENGVYVGVEATDDLFAMHQFKEYVGSANTCTVTWKGQTTCPTFLSGARVYLCVFNLNDGAWEIIDSENAADENTQFTLTYYFDDLTNYKDASNVVSFYVRQYNAI